MENTSWSKESVGGW